MQDSEQHDAATVFDRVGFIERIGGNEAFLKKLVASFIASVTVHLAALGDAVRCADSTAIRMHAHAVRGAAANIGAGHLSELSESMESAAQSGDLVGMTERYAALEQAFAVFKRVASASLKDQ